MSLRRAASVVSFATLLILAVRGGARAANDVWDNNPGGNWENGLNWTDGSTPGAGDAAVFDLGGSYPVTFGVAPAPIQTLGVFAGTVTFQSSGGAKTLSVNSGGSQDIVVTGGSTLILGTSGNPLNFTAGDDLNVLSNATLEARFGSDVVANDLSNTGLDGTVRIDGSGSSLTLNGSSQNLIANTAGGSLIFQNSSTGSVAGSLRIGDSASGVTGSVSITGGSTVNLGGNLSLATQNVASQNGTLTINGGGSSLTQSGASTITVGATTNGAAAINIGTTAFGGTLTTGTGLFTVNPTGTVTIGGAGATGTLNANGDVLINGGVLQRATPLDNSQFNLATGKTMTIQNGGLFSFLDFIDSYDAATNAVYNVTGTNSRFYSLGAVNLNNGSQANISSGGSIVSENPPFAESGINVGSFGSGTGTLVVDGPTSTATANESVFGGSGNSASVTFSHAAVGNFLSGIEIANDATVGTAAVVNVLTDAGLNAGSLSLATQGGSATMNINGGSSAVTQSGAATLTLGHATTGAAAINIGTAFTGGTLTTGAGLFTINGTGTVTVGSGAKTGSLIAGGDITIDGGLLQFNNAGSAFGFNNHTMNIQNGGSFVNAGFRNLGDASTYNVTGAGSELSISGAELRINNGTEVHVSAGGAVSTTSLLSIAVAGGDGTLTVAGSGSSATSTTLGGGAMLWGTNGDTATVTFSDNATGTFGNVSMADGATLNDADSLALVTVESGADVSFKDITMASVGDAATSATLTVTGAGSSVTLAAAGDNLFLGDGSVGSATVNVLDGGALTIGAGGLTVLNATGTINIDGGTAHLNVLFNNGGTLNFTAGSLSLAGDLTVGNGGQLGANLTLDTNKQLTINGTTIIDSSHTLALNGGTFSTHGLIVNGTLAFNAGTLNITGLGGLTIGSGGVFGSILSLGPGRTLNVTNTTTVNAGSLLVLENGGGFSSGAVNNNGEIVLDGPSAVLPATFVSNVGLLRGAGRVDAPITNQAAGEVRVATGERLQFRAAGGSLNSGRINLLGGTVEFTQSTLTNAASGQIIGHGSLIADTTLNSGTMAFSGQANVLGDVTNNASGKIISSGGGPTTFFDDVVNNGEIRTSPGSFTVFFGALSGTGTLTGTGTVNMEGDFSPGSSPAAIPVDGDLAFGGQASLLIELGGTTPGSQFDQLTVAGDAALDGQLIVSLINGFAPSAGQTFTILTAGDVTGAFDSELLPALPGFNFDVHYNPTSVVLTVSPAFTADFDEDGDVDGDDLNISWKPGFGPGSTADADNDGDSDGADFLAWQQQLGGGLTAASAVEPVPEPGALALVALAACGLAPVRQRPGSPRRTQTARRPA
jgi:hypothetical protein